MKVSAVVDKESCLYIVNALIPRVEAGFLYTKLFSSVGKPGCSMDTFALMGKKN